MKKMRTALFWVIMQRVVVITNIRHVMTQKSAVLNTVTNLCRGRIIYKSQFLNQIPSDLARA